MNVLKNNNLSVDKALVRIGVACLLMWTWVWFFYIYQKTDFLDDAYIYLHIANNILELGTAQFYPISENSSLLASSPLRLLLLVPATSLARLFTAVDLSDMTMRLTLYLSGGLTALLFLPFFLKQLQYWAYGVLFSGALAMATLSSLQMEGLLIFWVTYTFAMLFAAPTLKLDASLLNKAGYLTSLLILSRPEYGLVALLVMLCIIIYQRRWLFWVSYCVPLVICGGAWMIIAVLLDVWFIPTTYLSKVITAQLQMFSPDFYYVLPVQFNHFFFLNQFTIDQFFVPYVFLAIYFVLLVKLSQVYRFFVLFIALLLAILAKSAGNYIWYHENFFTVIVTLSFVMILQFLRIRVVTTAFQAALLVKCLDFKKSLWVMVMSIGLLSSFLLSSTVQNLTLALPYKILSAEAYRNIAARHVGNGLFQFPDQPPTYIKMMEIGIVSYYGGSSVWINDLGGLAQAGTLAGAQESLFAKFFPVPLLVTGDAENAQICQQFSTPDCVVHSAWAIPDATGKDKVVYHFEDLYFGLNPSELAVSKAE